MLSRYGIFCRVVELRSFTRAAEALGYSQSAVSQTVKVLEREMDAVLIDRRADGLRLTADGEQLYPHIRAVCAAERALEERRGEMLGLERSVVRLGTFTSVSRNLLPPLMQRFKERYPGVCLVLRQGEYSNISRWIDEGGVDLGFLCTEAVPDKEARVLYRDGLMAVLPPEHPLADRETLSLRDLADESFILLDEGERSMTLRAFEAAGLAPRVAYTVYDDYTILAMVRHGLGVSAIYEGVLHGFEQGIAVRPIREKPRRTVALAWRNWDTLPVAARRFAEEIFAQTGGKRDGRGKGGAG